MAQTLQRTVPRAQRRRGLLSRRTLQGARAKVEHVDPTSCADGSKAAKKLDLDRRVLRMGIPSKGRMADDTLKLLEDCQMDVKKVNPRQYVAKMAMFDSVEVWFQRATDVVRKLVEGDIDMGIVGYDLYAELAQGDDDLTLVHDALDFGHCRLSVAVPQGWAGVDSLQDLRAMGWSASEPLRVVTGYLNLAQEFFEREGFEHVQLTTADGALEAAPAMGTADAILDLVSSGTTLRENNLKELKGGTVVESEGVLIASRRALLERPDCLEVAHEMVERFDAHLRAQDQYLITANTRGSSAQEVADKLNRSGGDLLVGLQGPTISPIYSPKEGGEGVEPGHFFAVNIVVPRKSIFDAVKLLRQADGSGVCVAPITYIYDEEPPRWRKLVDKLGLPKEDAQALSRA